MKIKRYFAKDVKTAIQMVRDEQGPDAVIMSNNKVDDGVEIIAAIDYDDEIFSGKQRYGNSIADRKRYADDNNKSGENISSCNIRTDVDRYVDIAQSEDIRELKRQLDSVKEMLEGQMASLAWSGYSLKSPAHAHVIRRLVGLGFSETLSTDLVAGFAHGTDENNIWDHTLAELVNRIPVHNRRIPESGGIVALVGPTGVGKTTTAAKLAASYALKYGRRKVGIVTIDNYRVAAYEQMRVYGKIIDIPVRLAESGADLGTILNDYCDKELIIIDTAGLGQYDGHNASQAAILDQERFDVRKTLVISASTQYKAINDIIRSFDCYSPADCIITKMDESPTHGHVIDAICMNNLPISYITDGQEVPEDIHPAIAHDLVNRCIATGGSNADLPSDLMIAMNFKEATANA